VSECYRFTAHHYPFPTSLINVAYYFENVLSLIYFVSSRALAVSSTYGVTTAMSVSVIKDAVWDSFARTIS